MDIMICRSYGVKDDERQLDKRTNDLGLEDHKKLELEFPVYDAQHRWYQSKINTEN